MRENTGSPGSPPAVWAAFAAQGRWKSWTLVGLLGAPGNISNVDVEFDYVGTGSEVDGRTIREISAPLVLRTPSSPPGRRTTVRPHCA